MEKFIKIFLTVILTMTVSIVAACAIFNAHKPDHYALSVEVLDVDYESHLVLCKDGTGHLWEFSSKQIIEKGDIISLLMDGRHTPEVDDDKICQTTIGIRSSK